MQLDEEGIKNLLVTMVMKKQLKKDIDPKNTHTHIFTCLDLLEIELKNIQFSNPKP
jgi:hypothetical protein